MSWKNTIKKEEKDKDRQKVTFKEFQWVVEQADHSLMIYLDRNGKEIPEEYSHIYTNLAFNDPQDAYDLLEDRGIKIIKNTRARDWKNYDGD